MKNFKLNQNRNLVTNLFFFFLMTISSFAFANETNAPESIFDQMNYQQVLDMTLEVDVKSLTENRRSKEDYTATMSFVDATGTTQEWDTEVNIRGKYRRMNCAEMPPLKLNFKKGDLAAVGLSSSNDLKLVTYCVEDETEAKELLLKEYLAYKLYNIISDASYRVQLVNVTYKDINTTEELKQWAFLIEDTAQLRERLGADKCEATFNTTAKQYNADEFKTMALFQYMIGNSDWNTLMGKNIKVVKKGDKLMAIPYDFDFSGMVNAPYAKPNVDYQLTSVEDRVYLGFDKDVKKMEATYQHFVDHRSELLALVYNFELLEMSTRKEVILYLNDFFKEGSELKTKKNYTK